jgi:hypothetical protein
MAPAPRFVAPVPEDLIALSSLLDGLVARYGRPDDPGFLAGLDEHAAAVPAAIAATVRGVRGRTPLVLRLGPDVLGDLPPTPPSWRAAGPCAAPTAGMLTLLVGGLLGRVFGWATQQDGRLVHDIIPAAGSEHSTVSSSSLTALGWHTEDAFPPDRAHHLVLTCLRNPDGTPTTVAGVPPLDEDTIAVLREPRFRFVPDPSHGAGVTTDERQPVLGGDPADPSLRLDADYTRALPGDQEAAAALERICAAVDASLVPVALAPGDVLVVDNRRLVHGRAAFRPRHDGTDRWLKRAVVRA